MDFAILDSLYNYQSSYKEEENYKSRFISFLKSYDDCFSRRQQFGHVTGSSWIVNKYGDKALLMHHAKLNRWLQPGGHADGEENVLEVAYREASEETGLRSIKAYDTTIFDIDIHTIPANLNEKEHLHFDIRYLFTADDDEALSMNDESHDLKWFKLDEIINIIDKNDSIIRMVEKSLNLCQPIN